MAVNLFLSVFALILIPFFAGLMLLAPFFPKNTVKIRRTAKGFAVFELIYSLLFLLFLNPEGFSYQTKLPFDIIPNLHVTISFGLDSLSALLIVLVSFLTLMALMASKTMVQRKQRLFYSLIMILQGTSVGIFAAADPFTFTLFWMLEIIPVYFLISLSDSENAKKAAMKFALFAFSGTILMFISAALLYAYGTDTGMVVDYAGLLNKNSDFPLVMELIVSIGFLSAFVTRLPIFPFHSPIPDTCTHSNVPTAMLMSGLILQGAAYGLIRFNLQMFYEIFQIFAPTLIVLGSIGIIWSSAAAIAQNSIKTIVSYSLVASSGIILIGICSFTEFGLTGAIFGMVAQPLIYAGLFMAAGVIYSNFKTEKLGLLGGIAEFAPTLAITAVIIALGALSIPATIGFPAAFMSLAGGFSCPLVDEKLFFGINLVRPAVIISAAGIIFCAAYILRLLHKTFFSICTDETLLKENTNIKLPNHQVAVLSIIALAVLIFGIYPAGLTNMVNSFANTVIESIIAGIF